MRRSITAVLIPAAILAVMLTTPPGANAAHNDAVPQALPKPTDPDDPDSPFTPDGRCKPGRLGCFYIEPDGESEQPPDAEALAIMKAVRESIERLESRTPHHD